MSRHIPVRCRDRSSTCAGPNRDLHDADRKGPNRIAGIGLGLLQPVNGGGVREDQLVFRHHSVTQSFLSSAAHSPPCDLVRSPFNLDNRPLLSVVVFRKMGALTYPTAWDSGLDSQRKMGLLLKDECAYCANRDPFG